MFQESKSKTLILLVVVLLIIVVAPTLSAQSNQKDSIPFNPSQAQVSNVNGRWKIVVDNMWLMNFNRNRAEAERALEIIKHYGINEQCFVGRPDPSMTYFLSDSRAPAGPIGGEDCLSFNTSNLQVQRINGRWKIVEGSHWIMDFENNGQEARQALGIIQQYGFNNICFVGRPDPSMTYFRSDEATVDRPGPNTDISDILIYGRPSCGLCSQMKRNLDQDGIGYTFYDVDADNNRNREMWSHIQTVAPTANSVTFPVMVVYGTVLLAPTYNDVERAISGTYSGLSTSGNSDWSEGNYSRYTHETFFDYAPAKQRIGPAVIDYPLLQAAIFYETNRLRVNMGRDALWYDSDCAKAAQMHAEDMVSGGFFDHENPNDNSKRTLEDRARMSGINNYTQISENISHGDTDGSYIDIAREVVERWRNSRDHRKNLLEVWITHMGAGAYDAGSKWSDMDLYCVQVFVQYRH